MIYIISKDNNVSEVINGVAGKTSKVRSFTQEEELLSYIIAKPPKLVIVDCDINQENRIKTYRQIRRIDPSLAVILISSFVDIPAAITAARLGAADFLAKPLDKEKIFNSIMEALKAKEPLLDCLGPWLEGSSSLRSAMFKEINAVIGSLVDVSLCGEPGIDKKSIGEIIHRNSPVKGSFRAFNLASFSREEEEPCFWTTLRGLLSAKEAEKKELRISTLYLEGFDRLGHLFKGSLVKFLKDRRSNSDFDKAIRIIIESEREIIGLDEFKNISVAALRLRREDLPMILTSYIREYSAKLNRPIKGIGSDLVPFLAYYDFPGNFSELEELLKSAILRCNNEYLSINHFPLTARMLADIKKNELTRRNIFNLNKVRREFEKAFFLFVLANGGNDPALAARFLDMPKSVFEERLGLFS